MSQLLIHSPVWEGEGPCADGVRECESVHLRRPGMFSQRRRRETQRETGALPTSPAARRGLPPRAGRQESAVEMPGRAMQCTWGDFMQETRVEFSQPILSPRNTMSVHTRTGAHFFPSRSNLDRRTGNIWMPGAVTGPD